MEAKKIRSSGYTCAFKNCKNATWLCDLSFFRFPNDPERYVKQNF